ncbi:MAG: hypothetical protein JW895_08745 [Thermoleophilaceae bacterium]|nr:hypothetical protein [Thermoleophilaceae bacterium]
MAELRFRVGAIFPADNPTARYVMGLSIVLNDIRTALALAAREDLAAHERLYLHRLLRQHEREGIRLAVDEHREREDVRRFVDILPDEARAARDDLEAAAGAAPGDEPEMGPALEELADVESGLSMVRDEKRSDYADLVAAHLSATGSGEPDLERLLTFLEHAEAAWLRPWRG